MPDRRPPARTRSAGSRSAAAGRAPHVDTKICAACGRSFEWRRTWARDWEQVRYCSDRCRRAGAGDPTDSALERAILDLLDTRPRGATICPSEAARRVDPDDWRPLMERARSAARRLVAGGAVEITQRGVPIDPSTARGPIRIRRVDR